MKLNGVSPRHLTAARALLGWTQGRLGKEASLSTAAVARIEAGTADARLSTLEAILDVLGGARHRVHQRRRRWHWSVAAVRQEASGAGRGEP